MQREQTAEARFRAAFERLKAGASVTMPTGTAVSQNNVAREAGCDPSALRKSRFPELIAEIRDWVSLSSIPPPAPGERDDAQLRRQASFQMRLVAMKAQRDHALALLVQADAVVLELTMENLRLRAGQTEEDKTIVPFRPR